MIETVAPCSTQRDSARLVKVRGRLQKADGVIHVVAEHLVDATEKLGLLREDLKDFGGLAHAEADVALAVTDGDEGDEGHARTTLDDLGHAVDVDDALLEVSLLLALAITRHSDSS